MCPTWRPRVGEAKERCPQSADASFSSGWQKKSRTPAGVRCLRQAMVRRRTKILPGPVDGMCLVGQGECVPMTFQDGATHEHVDNLCADVRRESPETFGLSPGQTKPGHFLKLGADTYGKLLNVHLCDAFLWLMHGSYGIVAAQHPVAPQRPCRRKRLRIHAIDSYWHVEQWNMRFKTVTSGKANVVSEDCGSDTLFNGRVNFKLMDS
jgi:hypothetical protein